MRDALGRRPAQLASFYAHTVLVQAVTFVLRPTAVYQAIALDVPTAWLGALGASFALVPLVLAVPTGRIADVVGERRVLLAGAALTVLACLGFVLLSGSIGGLVASCVALGTGHLLAVVAQQALVANDTAPARYDTAFGHYTFAASAGQAVGPGLIVLFGGSAPIPDTGAIFVWSLGLSLLLPLASLTLRSSSTARTARDHAPGTVRDLLRRRGLVRALSTSCVVLAAVDISLVYLPALGTERDIAAGTIGALLAVRAAASMTSRFFLGRLVARFGRGRLLGTSIALAATGMAVLPLPMPTWLLVGVVAAMGLGLGAGQPVTMSWLAEATPAGMRGRAMSLRLTGNRLGQVVVPTAAGFLAVGAGAAGVLWVTAAALVAVGLVSRGVVTDPPSPS